MTTVIFADGRYSQFLEYEMNRIAEELHLVKSNFLKDVDIFYFEFIEKSSSNNQHLQIKKSRILKESKYDISRIVLKPHRFAKIMTDDISSISKTIFNEMCQELRNRINKNHFYKDIFILTNQLQIAHDIFNTNFINGVKPMYSDNLEGIITNLTDVFYPRIKPTKTRYHSTIQLANFLTKYYVFGMYLIDLHAVLWNNQVNYTIDELTDIIRTPVVEYNSRLRLNLWTLEIENLGVVKTCTYYPGNIEKCTNKRNINGLFCDTHKNK